ncbi:MAG: class I SAM-dependent methyltransferase [Pseudolabrys sp.]|nr:class I SAM-dependent methyltransferase [Pseudolabrys sp.]
MAGSDAVFSGSIPDMYDRLMVPLIFQPYAEDVARRAAQARPEAVLEIAAGTGAVTRALSRTLGEARIVATDLNQPMLDFARAHHPQADRIAWRQADALALPFDDRSFDVVVCQFGAMFFPDKVKGYREARRVLRPGGVYLFNVWDRIEENAFADVITNALATVYPGDPPRFLARTPHGYHDTAQIERELRAAGFDDLRCDAVDAISRSASARDPAIAYCHGTPLRNEIEARDPDGLGRATNTAEAALQREFGAGAIEGPIRAYVFSARF